jgi:hypothetical protein
MLPTLTALHLTQPTRGFLRAGVALVTESGLGLPGRERVEEVPLSTPTTDYGPSSAAERGHRRYSHHQTAAVEERGLNARRSLTATDDHDFLLGFHGWLYRKDGSVPELNRLAQLRGDRTRTPVVVGTEFKGHCSGVVT